MADHNWDKSRKEKRSHSSRVAILSFCYTAALATVHRLWMSRVNREVPEPYLDEVFHVGQAQRYCRWDWTWDPKITTPPGLYVLSLFFHSIPKLACNVQLLRALNGLLLNTTLFTCAFMYRDAITSPQTTQVRRSQNGPSRSLQKLSADLHTALNIALFPPLFFFSGLYYTDVASTAFALAFLTVYFRRTKAVSGDRFLALLLNIVVESLVLKGKGPIGTIIIFLAGQIGPAVNSSDENDGAVSSEKPHQSRVPGKWAFPDMLLVGYGIVAICLRQTNIFWVTVFPAGLSLASFLRAQKGSSNDSLDKLLKRSWNDQTGFDPPTGASSVLDFVKSPLSMVVASVSILVSSRRSIGARVTLVVNHFGAYLILLLVFAAFVVFNGGVVLGDKPNHIATLHLPQMLYIWPLMAFFSLPLLLPPVLGAVLPQSFLPSFLHHFASSSLSLRGSLLASGVGILALMLAAIDQNTIVHPFTLADNRHYVFYVFRILLRYPAVKYLAAPVYLACAWAVLQALGAPSSDPQSVSKESQASRGTGAEVGQYSPLNNQPRVSAVSVWLLTTSLCLITAPLVEPRYFILPWITWRLMLPALPESHPAAPTTDAAGAVKSGGSDNAPQRRPDAAEPSKLGGFLDGLVHRDYRLVMETAWFLLINAVTGYVFLYRGFEWPQEPGNVQRFMW